MNETHNVHTHISGRFFVNLNDAIWSTEVWIKTLLSGETSTNQSLLKLGHWWIIVASINQWMSLLIHCSKSMLVKRCTRVSRLNLEYYSLGLEVAKPISHVSLFTEYFSITKTRIGYSISRLCLARPRVTTAELRWYLSKMNVIKKAW